MPNSPTTYYDDDELREALGNVNSYRTLHEIYGLFYGCAMSGMHTGPARCLPDVFDAEHSDNVSAEAVEILRNNLMSLWNFVTRWKPAEEPFFFPDQDYPNIAQGLLEHVADDVSLIESFFQGLDPAGKQEKDLSGAVKEALHDLAELKKQLQSYAELYEAVDPEAEVKDPQASRKKLAELEEIIARCITKIAVGLKRPKR